MGLKEDLICFKGTEPWVFILGMGDALEIIFFGAFRFGKGDVGYRGSELYYELVSTKKGACVVAEGGGEEVDKAGEFVGREVGLGKSKPQVEAFGTRWFFMLFCCGSHLSGLFHCNIKGIVEGCGIFVEDLGHKEYNSILFIFKRFGGKVEVGTGINIILGNVKEFVRVFAKEDKHMGC